MNRYVSRAQSLFKKTLEFIKSETPRWRWAMGITNRREAARVAVEINLATVGYVMEGQCSEKMKAAILDGLPDKPETYRLLLSLLEQMLLHVDTPPHG